MSLHDNLNKSSYTRWGLIIASWFIVQELVIVSSYNGFCYLKPYQHRSRNVGALHAIESNYLRNKTKGIYSNTSYTKLLNKGSELYLYSDWIVENDNDEKKSFFRKSHRKNRMKMQLLKPLEVCYGPTTSSSTRLDISSGLTFDNGDQLLVSAQKPLGLVLEERSTEEGGCIVVQVAPGSVAEKSGIRKGDMLVAVQNQNVENMKLEHVMEKIISAPKVVNLRFLRG
jgi:membrane-associated protease RseP (regulator of RpoE activity)